MAGPHDKQHRDDATRRHAPTAGPDYDDRGPDPQREQEAALRAAHIQLAHDRSARILKVEIKDSRSVITLGAGRNQGVTQDMIGYVTGSHGPVAEFTVSQVGDATCTAEVQLTVDQLASHDQVLINPSHRMIPTLPPGSRAPLLAVSIENGRTRIKFGKGQMQGVTFGLKGVVVGANGSELADFTVDELGPSFSGALVDLTLDALQGASVILGR